MKYSVWTSAKDKKWYWNLVARNGEIIASSQGYSSKQAALKGIRAVKLSLLAKIVEV